ncbi:MAG: hypothetical protein NC182_05310 [Prevotella sp.]|nr:hypothetical protein [Prevotella sp.]
MRYIQSNYGVDLTQGINLRFKRVFVRENRVNIDQSQSYQASGTEEVNAYVLVNITIADYQEKERFASLKWQMNGNRNIQKDTQIELIDDQSIRYCDFDTDISFEKSNEELMQLYQNVQKWTTVFQKKLIQTTTWYTKDVIFDLTNFANDYFTSTQKSLTFLMHIQSKDSFLLLDYTTDATNKVYLSGYVKSLKGIGKGFALDTNMWKELLIQQVNTYTKDAYIIYPGLAIQDGPFSFGVSLIYQDQGVQNKTPKNRMRHSYDYQLYDNRTEIIIEDPTGYLDIFYFENGEDQMEFINLETQDKLYCDKINQSYRVEKGNQETWYYETIDGQIHLSKIIYSYQTLVFHYVHHRLLEVTNQRKSIYYSYDIGGTLLGLSTTGQKESLSLSYDAKQNVDGFIYQYHLVQGETTNSYIYRKLSITYSNNQMMIYHQQTQEKMWIQYQNSEVKSVAIGYILSNAIPKYYDYHEGYTQISHLGKNIYYYYDYLGRILYQLNSNDMILSNQYQLPSHTHFHQVITQSQTRIKRQWLENGSFDEDTLDDYIIKGKLNSHVERIQEEQRTYLRIQKKDKEKLTIEQTIALDPADEVITLSGYYRLNHLKSSIDCEIKVEVIGTYSKYIDALVPGEESGTYETIQKLAQYSQTLSTMTLPIQATSWEKFILPKASAYYRDMITTSYTIRITCSGEGYSLGIDDLSVADTPEVIQPNYIHGGYFFQADIQKLKGFTLYQQSSGDVIEPITTLPLSMPINCLLLEHVRQCNPYQYQSKSLEYIMNVEGKQGDTYTLRFFIQAYSTTEDLPQILFVFSNDVGDYSYDIPVTPYVKGYQYVSVKMKAPVDYQSIEFHIFQQHIYDIRVAGIELVKGEEVFEYKYDQNGNIIQIQGKTGYERYVYNEHSQCMKQVDSLLNHTTYQYDQYQNVVQSTLNAQVRYQNEYNEQNDLIQQWIEDTNTRQKQAEYTYDDDHHMTSTTDAMEQTTTYQYDLRDRITLVDYPNGVSVRNSYGITDELKTIYVRTQDEQIGNITQNLAYDNWLRMASCQQNQDHQYTINYDIFGNIQSVQNQDTLLQEDAYQKEGPLKQRKYTNNQQYNYTYNEAYQLESVSYNHQLKAKYIYQKNQLMQIKDDQDQTIVEYRYDEEHFPIQTRMQDVHITYQKEKGEIRQKVIQLKDRKQVYSYEWGNSQNEYTKVGFFERLFQAYHADGIDADNDTMSDQGISFVQKEVRKTSEIPRCLSWQHQNSQLLFSPIAMIKNSHEPFTYTVVLWIKPHQSYGTKETVLSLCYLNESIELLNLKIDAKGYLYWIEENQYTYTTTQQMRLEEWNMLVVSIQRKTSMTNAYDLSLSVNGKKSTVIQSTFTHDIIQNFHQDMKLRIGNGTNHSTPLQMPFEIYKIMITDVYFNSQALLACYQQSIQYLCQTTPSYRYTTTSWVNEKLTQQGDVVTLRGTKASIRGKRPIESSTLESSYIQNLSREYHYDQKENRHIYGMYQVKHLEDICLSGQSYVAYDLELEDIFTIGLRVKWETPKSLHDVYLMCFIRDGIIQLGVKILAHEQMQLIVNNQTLQASLRFDSDIWHTMLIQCNQQSILTIIIDGKKTDLGVQQVDLTSSICYLGCGKENGEIIDVLCGEIENFYYTNSALMIEEDQVEEILTPSIYQKKYDHWNRLVETKFKTHQHTFTKTYTYLNHPISITPIVQTEIEEDTQIEYQYDNEKIINICTRKNEDATVLDQVSYAYDQLGRLIKETTYQDETIPQTEISYTYDNYQNMTQKVIQNDITGKRMQIDYQYNNTYKTRLDDIIIGEDTIHITYDRYYALNPTSITKNNQVYKLAFEGTQLTKIGEHINYKYDILGRRVEKIIQGKSTKYIYDDNQIVEMQIGEDTIQYNYDESNQIIGFSYQGKTYYYEKDILGNINGIINEEGKTIVRYQYDGYGNHQVYDENGKENKNEDFIGNINPYRYRGYVYDVETQLFYCNSRYYSPELCRWISPDSIDYLDPESINGLNLYAYAKNNPIMYYDPSGHLPEWAAWLISGSAIVGGIILCATGVGGVLGGALIGAGAGSLINGYVTKANGGDFTAGYIGGAISGALCGVGAGLGGMAFTAASEVANLACIGYMALGVTASFAGGFVGNLAGTVYTSWHESGFKNVNINWGETLLTSAVMGSLNIFAGMGSAMSSIAGSMGRVATDLNSKFALRLLSGMIAGGTEAAYDLISYLIGKLLSAF